MSDIDLSAYHAHAALKEEFVRSVGYAGKLEIPDALVRKLAEFVDNHPTDMMTTYYTRSLLATFYRRRTKERSIRLFDLMNEHMVKKGPLIDIFLRTPSGSEHPVRFEYHDIAAIWQAIDELGDGYSKANWIGKYASLFTDSIADLAYESILTMSEPFKTRALGGLYARMDAQRKREILAHVCNQFIAGAGEAVDQLKLMFPFMDEVSRSEVVALHLDTPGVPDGFLAFLIVRNAAYFGADDASKLIARVRDFKSAYLRNRCLLKLITHLKRGQVEELFERFMLDFGVQPASIELIHNLYQFGAVVKEPEHGPIIELALEKIASLDDTGHAVYEQQKYGQMLFLMPLLTEVHSDRAFSIAETVRGGYRRTLKARLKAHFANTKGYCDVIYAPICY